MNEWLNGKYKQHSKSFFLLFLLKTTAVTVMGKASSVNTHPKLFFKAKNRRHKALKRKTMGWLYPLQQ